MDAVIQGAARRLAAGDVLGALERVSLREDAPALALRGIALARLGEFDRARALLERAAVELESPAQRARCVAALAEIAIAARELDVSFDAIDDARDTLLANGDSVNAAYADLVAIRATILLGRIEDAHRRLAHHTYDVAPATLVAVRNLLDAEVAVRRLDTTAAAEAFARAARAAEHTNIPALVAEVAKAAAVLDASAARIVDEAGTRSVTLAEVESLLRGPAVVVDACRRKLRRRDAVVDLVRKSTLFELLLALALAGPEGVSRDALIRDVFAVRRPNASHRARLRVDASRLRKSVAGLASVDATATGFALRPEGSDPIVVLLPPIDGAHGALLALLADGERWSTSALATAAGTSRRTVQRALSALEAEGRVQAFGRGPARRWLAAPLSSIATSLLLPIDHLGR